MSEWISSVSNIYLTGQNVRFNDEVWVFPLIPSPLQGTNVYLLHPLDIKNKNNYC